jgi:hypothetical protein
MANAYGGLILVGITDLTREIVGVSREAMAHVADGFATHLESPDWQPEMIEVPVGERAPDRYVLVIRINRDIARRPVFVQREGRGSFFLAPVRMPGSTRQATRDELYALFTEQQPAEAQVDRWELNRPDIPRTRDGLPDSAVDFVIRSGLIVPVGPTAWGRPISQRVMGELAAGLDGSVLVDVLLALTRLPRTDIQPFHVEGLANRSNIATMVWRLQPREPVPFDMLLQVEVPGHYGRSHVGALTLTLRGRLIRSDAGLSQRLGCSAAEVPQLGAMTC